MRWEHLELHCAGALSREYLHWRQEAQGSRRDWQRWRIKGRQESQIAVGCLQSEKRRSVRHQANRASGEQCSISDANRPTHFNHNSTTLTCRLSIGPRKSYQTSARPIQMQKIQQRHRLQIHACANIPNPLVLAWNKLKMHRTNISSPIVHIHEASSPTPLVSTSVFLFPPSFLTFAR